MRHKADYGSGERRRALIQAARGEVPSDLVLRGGRWLDVFGGAFMAGDVAVKDGTIVGVGDSYGAGADGRVLDLKGAFVVPGFIDAHVHIESSLMTPARFEEAVLPRGTTTVIWDPHEIANVRGIEGIEWALAASADLALDVMVMIPSCVPSTTPELGLETSGAVLRAADVARFRGHERVLGLAEMMNFPGLLGGEADVLAKLEAFSGMRLDGHCPGLSGKDLNAYGVAGIHSCHESTTLEEAREKLAKGIHVLIREGSCARNADTLLPLLTAYTSSVLAYCSDDRNPADIAEAGHIDCLVNKALRRGIAPESAFRAAAFGPARAYGLMDRGALAPGFVADLVVVRPRARGDGAAPDWSAGVEVEAVFKRGRAVDAGELARRAGGNQRAFAGQNLRLPAAAAGSFRVPAPAGAGSQVTARVIGVIPGQIVTTAETAAMSVVAGEVVADPGRDLLKIAVIERYSGRGGSATAFVRGFGLRDGAIATSINHDSHNVIVVGDGDEAMARAVNRLREIDGGIVVAGGGGALESLPLPIGGLMTGLPPAEVAAALRRLKALAKSAGCRLEEPFLTLSFLALPVIPALKITDKGLVDVTRFGIVPVCL